VSWYGDSSGCSATLAVTPILAHAFDIAEKVPKWHRDCFALLRIVCGRQSQCGESSPSRAGASLPFCASAITLDRGFPAGIVMTASPESDHARRVARLPKGEAVMKRSITVVCCAFAFFAAGMACARLPPPSEAQKAEAAAARVKAAAAAK
jgi:hypothetical protein